MSSTLASKHLSIKDYLRLEAESGERYEYYDRKTKRMPGGTISRNRICRNVIALLDVALRDTNKFEVFGSDQKIYLPKYNFYLYPDTVVVTADPILSDEETHALINPILILEVLSPSTEQYDRGTKFMEYGSLESLQEYGLIRQETPEIITMYRSLPGHWMESIASGINESIIFRSIDVSLKMKDIYRKVL